MWDREAAAATAATINLSSPHSEVHAERSVVSSQQQRISSIDALR
jgi:hypothetical protein